MQVMRLSYGSWLPKGRMDLRQLHYFIEVAKTGNLTRAATRVYISQPALSRQIQLLESELGVKLMERKARGIVLTEAGELLHKRASSLIKDASLLKEEVGAQANEPSGSVGLSIPSSLRALLISKVAGDYASTYPKVHLNIREGMSRAARDMVATGETDAAIFSTQEPINSLNCQPLLSEQLFAVGTVEARLSLRCPLTVEALCRNPLVLTGYPNSLRQIVDQAAAAAGTIARARIEVDMATLMLDLVRCGLGYAVLPYCAIDDGLKAGLISAAPVLGMRINWLVATSRERAQSIASARLIELIFSEARQLVSSGRWLTAELSN
jgi:LysR family nitrogen assimilation transcriptional regulator